MPETLTDTPAQDAGESEIDWESLYGVKPAWEPSTEADMDWVVERIAEAEGTAERIRRNADAAIAAAQRKAQFFRDRYSYALEDFARKRLEGQKGRTVALLNGSLKFTKVPSRIALEDDPGRLAEWVHTNHPELLAAIVRETVAVNKTELKRLLVASANGVIDVRTGEVVDIAWVEPEGERFTVSAK